MSITQWAPAAALALLCTGSQGAPDGAPAPAASPRPAKTGQDREARVPRETSAAASPLLKDTLPGRKQTGKTSRKKELDLGMCDK